MDESQEVGLHLLEVFSCVDQQLASLGVAVMGNHHTHRHILGRKPTSLQQHNIILIPFLMELASIQGGRRVGGCMLI